MAMPTKAQKKWLKRIKDSGCMLVTLDKDGPYYTLPDGTPIRTDLARNLIDADLVKPQQDGLFPGETQSYAVPDANPL
jgi:hypothetical protein